MNTTSKGNKFETIACKYLVSKNFTIVDRNYHAKKLGEIDIIAIHDSDPKYIQNVTQAQFYKLVPKNK